MISTIRHWIAIIVFGLIIPVYAFLLAYPGGPREMYERSTYQLTKPTITIRKDFVLPDMFSPFDPHYIEAAGSLLAAPEGSQINLIVKNNFGGYATVLFMLQGAIENSKAYVLVTVDKFGLSCGTYILGMGDIILIPHDVLLLFHTGRIGDTITTVDSLDPEVIGAYAEVSKVFAPYKGWITTDEYEEFKHGKDIWVTGRQICGQTEGRNVDVLFQTADGCAVRGMRHGMEVKD